MNNINENDLNAAMYALAETGRSNRVDRSGVWFPIQYTKLAHKLGTYAERVKEILNILMINKRIEIKADGSYKRYCKLLDVNVPDAAWFQSYRDSLFHVNTTLKPAATNIMQSTSTKRNDIWEPSSRMLKRGSGSGSTYEIPINNTLSAHDSFRLARKTTDYKTVRERQNLC